MHIIEYLYEANIRTGLDVGVVISRSDLDAPFRPIFARIASLHFTVRGVKEPADFVEGRDIMLEWSQGGVLSYMPLILADATEYTYTSGRTKLAGLLPDPHDHLRTHGVLVGQPQLIIATKRGHVSIGQEDDYLQSVCETMVALAQ